MSDVVAVSLGIWLASVPPFNRLLLPPPLIPFLLFLHATDSVSVSGADPSMSADEEENQISLTFPPMSLVPVLVTTSAQSCSHFCLGFQFQEACCFGFGCPPSSRVALESSAESPVDLQDKELDELQSHSDSPSPSRSCRCKARFCICKVFCYKVRFFLLPSSLFLLLKSPFL